MPKRQIFLPGGGGGGDGTTNAKVIQRIAFSLSNRLSALLSSVKTGIGIIQGLTEVTIRERIGIAVSTHVDSAEVKNIQRPSIKLRNMIEKNAIHQVPAVSITEIEYTLSSVKGSNVVTQEAVGGRSDWQVIANAQGVNNGINSTFAGNALAARSGMLHLAYADYIGKSELTIVSVHIDFYVTVSGTLVNNGDVQLSYDIGAGIVTLQTITGNSAVVPITHDITAAIGGDWEKLNALVTRVRAAAALGEIWTATCDAVVVRVAATRTETL